MLGRLAGPRYVRGAAALLPVLLLIALWLPGLNQGDFRVDTGLYAAISRYAYQTGDLLTLHAGDQPYFRKPPLAFWIHGLALWALGPHLWVARLPSLIAAALATLATMRAVRTLAGRRLAFATGLTLVTTIEFFRYTRAISLDLWLACFLALALVPAAQAVRRNDGRWLVLAGAPVGLALLVKPLVALLTLVVLAAWLAWLGRVRQVIWLAPAALLAILIAAPWHVYMIVEHGSAFLDTYLLKESVQRATGERFGAKPATFLLHELGLTYWPWMVALVAGLFVLLRRGHIAVPLRQRSVERLGVAGLVIWLLAMSVFAGKQTRYLAHVYPYMSMVCAAWLVYAAPRALMRPLRRLAYSLPPLLIVCLVGLSLTRVRVHPPPEPQWIALERFLAELDGAPIWVDPHTDLLPMASKIYLLSGRWPATAVIEPHVAAQIGATYTPSPDARPAVGDYMIFRTDSYLDPRAVDEVVFRSAKLLVVRITARWDGAVRVTPLERRHW